MIIKEWCTEYYNILYASYILKSLYILINSFKIKYIFNIILKDIPRIQFKKCLHLSKVFYN